MISENDNDGKVNSQLDDSMKDKKDDNCVVEEKTTQEVPNKKGEPKIDLRTLPFP